MSYETKKNAGGSDSLDELIRCPMGDCGWCYATNGFECGSHKGCIGLDKCKVKHRSDWIAYLSPND